MNSTRVVPSCSELQKQILKGIEKELEKTTQFVEYRVRSATKEGELWIICVDLAAPGARGLDESMEDARAWWPGNSPQSPPGVAEVLSVLPEEEQINLRYATGDPPRQDGPLRLYPPRYLEALKECWTDGSKAQRAFDWYRQALGGAGQDTATIVDPGPLLANLREGQAQAFGLLRWRTSFLWGPPGTGKTYTLGAILARYVVSQPASRVLLLSTTNSAVDQALISVDKALEGLGHRVGGGLRKGLRRIGAHFVANAYKGREHLLPDLDMDLIRELAHAETQVPDKHDGQAYAAWKERVEALRGELRLASRRALAEARLAAMTTTRAVWTYSDLLELSPFDLLVFDEASQIAQAHALVLAPLGKRVLYAGDPKQIAPVVCSKHPMARRWLGKSPFTWKSAVPQAAKVMLDEQSRMAEPICDIVSNLFYEGKLRVAGDALRDDAWRKARQPANAPSIGNKHVVVWTPSSEGCWSQKYHGPIRFDSAQFVAKAVSELCPIIGEAKILVMTPFRAQRTLIRKVLRDAGFAKVDVTTVHRAQGRERHTVIFDPSEANNKFLLTDDAEHIVNVALSRAMAQLIVLISAGDRANRLFDRIAKIASYSASAGQARSLGEAIADEGFPVSVVGKLVDFSGKICRVLDVTPGDEDLVVEDIRTAKVMKFRIAVLLRSVGLERNLQP